MEILFIPIVIGASIWYLVRRMSGPTKAQELEERFDSFLNSYRKSRQTLEDRIKILEREVAALKSAARTVPDNEEAPTDKQTWAQSIFSADLREAASPVKQPPAASAESPAKFLTQAAPPPLPTQESSQKPSFDEPVADIKNHQVIDWERWVGVRGAALLGGIVLAIAGLLFLRYSIERGLIPPIMRVTISIIAGVACVVGSEFLRKRDYQAAANPLSGAGFVLLYGAFWAARVLYGLIGNSVAFGLLALVTVSCGLLSWRRNSLVIASIGLAGGLAAPYLLSSNQDNPLGLFGYLLLLDLGVLFLARARRWPGLALASLAGTAVYEFAWVLLRMGPDRPILGLAILGLFFLLFLFAKKQLSFEGSKVLGEFLDAGTLLVPCSLAFYFAANTQTGEHLYPMGALLFLVLMGSFWMGWVHGVPWFGILAATATSANVLVWLAKATPTPAHSWEAFLVMAVLAAGSLASVEIGKDSKDKRSIPPILLAAGFILGHYLFIPGSGAPCFWPWVLGVVVMSAVLFRMAMITGNRFLFMACGVLSAFAFVRYYAHGGGPGGELTLFYGIAIGCALLLQSASMLPMGEENRRSALKGAVLFSLVLLSSFFLSHDDPALWPMLFFGATMLAGLLAISAATRMVSGGWYFAATAMVALTHWFWALTLPLPDANDALTGLISLGLCVVIFTFWPLIVGRVLLSRPFARYAAALAGPLWFMPLKSVYIICYGKAAIGVLPLALGTLSLVAAYLSRAAFNDDPVQQRNNLAWFAGAALAFISVAIPLQLSNEWITVGWALEGFAVVALWSRINHPGLRYFGLALLFAVTVRLIANPSIFEYHHRQYWPVVNWLLYTYGVSAAALLGSHFLLKPLEVERRSTREASFYDGPHPLGAYGSGLAALLVIFVWINLTIFDIFSSQPILSISLDRLPARDLTLSLAWAVYALLLLSIGIMRRIGGLRWVSLAFLLITITKVFLYDLGELKDLYRVASLVGLAFSLLMVSLAYQRFVFRKNAPGEKS